MVVFRFPTALLYDWPDWIDQLQDFFATFSRISRGRPVYTSIYIYIHIRIYILPTSIYCCARKFSPEFICATPSTNSIYIEHQYTINILADIYLVFIPLENPFLDKPYNQFTGGKLCRCPQFQRLSIIKVMYFLNWWHGAESASHISVNICSPPLALSGMGHEGSISNDS